MLGSCLNPYFLLIRMEEKKKKGLKTFNLYSWEKNCEPWEGSEQLPHRNTACITFILHTQAQTHACTDACTYTHMHANSTRNKKLIRTNKACLNVQLHISVHTHAHTGTINLFRLVACFNYYNQPPIIASTSVAVAVKNKLRQFHLWAQKQTLSPLSPL